MSADWKSRDRYPATNPRYNGGGENEPKLVGPGGGGSAKKGTSLYDEFKDLDGFYDYLAESNPVELAAWEQYSPNKFGDCSDPKAFALAMKGFNGYARDFAKGRLEFLTNEVYKSVYTGIAKDMAAEGFYGFGVRSAPLLGGVLQAGSAALTLENNYGTIAAADRLLLETPELNRIIMDGSQVF